jgi:superfamily II DNA/RNA helicase
MWDEVKRDPKLIQFLDELHADKKLRENKIIIFTESKETAEYLQRGIEKSLSEKILLFTGGSSSAFREKVIENFDAKAKHRKDEYRILLSTEVLSEGVNLHRSNIVINYDIPWNPTRLMQRVGRINRVDTKFKKIFTYNFFPTVQSNNQIKLREAAEAKIHSFIEMLGADAKLLTEGEEIKSHDLFRRLTSKKVLTGEDEEEDSELRYLQMIREIRDKDPVLFERVKRLPKKARTSREFEIKNNALLTYFRKGKLQKFYKCDTNGSDEVDFFTAAEILSCRKNQKRMPIGKDFYEFLDINKIVFDEATDETLYEPEMRGRDTATAILKILNSRQMRDFKGFTEFDDDYLREARRLLRDGGLPKHTLKRLKKDLTDEIDPFKILAKLKKDVPSEFFEEMFSEKFSHRRSSREVILSEYLVSENG